MTKNGYPSRKELKLIKEWNSNDFIGLIEFIKTIWTYPKDTIITNWYNDSVLGLYLRLELITSGLSCNESIIHALGDNVYMHHMWYAEWYVGGHHVWKIYPSNCGFKLVSDYCKEKGISRQAIHKNKNKYKFIIVSKNKRLIKLAKTSN